MAEYVLVVGNKTYSSWSLRGWLAARLAGIDFEERLVRLSEPDRARPCSGIRRPARCRSCATASA